MTPARTTVLTLLAMIAFAGNSLLCRVALTETVIDPASFTTIRLISGAVVLWLIVRVRGSTRRGKGNWVSALALFAYAAGFSFAYVSLPAGTGALLLFGAVQVTMIGYGMSTGERVRKLQMAGLALALGGLIGLLVPGLSAPPLVGSLMMLSAGVAWGVYSLRGRAGGDPMQVTSENFLCAVPVACGLSFALFERASLDYAGVGYAFLSGAFASGIGYAIWYTALPSLRASTAAIVQLSVPVIAAAGGILLLNEPPTLRLVLTSAAILGGIALFVLQKQHMAGAARVDARTARQ